ncbi:MAG TPA: hypothetical protein VM577_21480 [Anaerovoracaceae bacterium]|nr:hypothetical protein [Anaerovoracaceae bacterium]
MENQIENENEMDSDETETTDEVTAEAAPTTTEAAPVKRSRGRPKGVKVGPRERVWDCAAIVDGELIHDRLVAAEGSTPEERGSFTAEQARTQFEEEYGVEPTSIHGPYYDQKGAQVATKAVKRETVSIPLNNLKLTSQRENAIFKGWRGVAYGIEGREDAVFFMYHEELQPNPDKKRAIPQARPVLRSALDFENS